MSPDHAIIEIGSKVIEAYTRVDGNRVYVYNGRGVIHHVPSSIVLKQKTEDIDIQAVGELLRKL